MPGTIMEKVKEWEAKAVNVVFLGFYSVAVTTCFSVLESKAFYFIFSVEHL